MTTESLGEYFRPLRSWWRNDRIRASPREGRLLRIQPGDVLIFGDIQAEVFARSPCDGPAGICLRLTCETKTGSAELQVNISPEGKLLNVVWKDAESCRRCGPDDFEVWPRNHMI